jgi:hypothetical protein
MRARFAELHLLRSGIFFRKTTYMNPESLTFEQMAQEPELYAVEFSQGADGWSGGFADYPVGEDVDYRLEWGWRLLPAPFSGHGFHLAGTNRSDDLFMFLKRKITGLQPNSSYLFAVEVTFATNAPKGCAGTGGAPGESVYLKSGISTEEPRALQKSGSWRMNIDKGDQSTSGKDASVIGNVANSSSVCSGTPYEMKTVRGVPVARLVRTSSDGSLWLLMATDSGFESMTSLYYTNVRLLGKVVTSM